jgi:acyl-CoA thioesterase I
VNRLAALLALALALALAGCAAPAPPVRPVRPVPPAPPPSPGIATIVTLGDSVPAGTACGCDPFPALYARLLTPPARSVDLAEPGYTSSDVRGQLDGADARAALRRADLVLIMAGANDLVDDFDNGRGDDAYRREAADVRRNVAAIVAVIRTIDAASVTVLVLGYWNVVEDGAVGLADYGTDGLRDAESATRYTNMALRQAADSAGARYVPTTPTFKGSARDRDPTGLLAADGDHPNARGHRAIADALYAALPAVAAVSPPAPGSAAPARSGPP